jgi:hypothetical protein
VTLNERLENLTRSLLVAVGEMGVNADGAAIDVSELLQLALDAIDVNCKFPGMEAYQTDPCRPDFLLRVGCTGCEQDRQQSEHAKRFSGHLHSHRASPIAHCCPHAPGENDHADALDLIANMKQAGTGALARLPSISQ